MTTRAVGFVAGLLVVATVALITWLAIAPSPATPAPAVQTVRVEPAGCSLARADADRLARDITRMIRVGRVRVRTFNVLVARFHADVATCEAAS